MNEQQEIARSCSNIEGTTLSIISGLENELDLLDEYRTRLISDVVTGKLDVRGVAVPEFDVVEDAMVEGADDNTGYIESEDDNE
jgi:type I restriction enzyme S subunit